MSARQAVQVPTDMEADVDDLRGTIAAAIEAQQEPEAPSEPIPLKASKSSAPAPEPEVPRSGSEVPASTPAGAETTQPEPTDPAAVPAADKVEPPSNWSKADKERFAEWPKPAQEQFLERFKAQEADYTRKTMEVADLKREYAPVDQMFAPYKDALRQQGRTPSSIIRDWANAEAALSNPATRNQAILGIIRGYNVNVADLFGQQAQPQAQQPRDPATMTEQEQLDALLNPYIRQAVTPYEQKMAQLEAQVNQFRQYQSQAVQQQQHQVFQGVVNEVETFANAKDSQGNVLHPYFRDVENDMAAMMAGYANLGRPIPSLEELYHQAVRANPSTYERLSAQQRVAAEASRTQEARAKSAQARRAGSSVVGTPGSGQPFAHANGDGRDLSLRETLQAALEANRA